MQLFEGGILDKITNDEYEKMFQSMDVNAAAAAAVGASRQDDGEVQSSSAAAAEAETIVNGIGSGLAAPKVSSEKELTALSLRMLQGAFYLVFIGYLLAFVVLLLEIACQRNRIDRRTTLFHLSNRFHTRLTRINRIRLSPW